MLQHQIDQIVKSLKSEDLRATLSTLSKIFDNAVQHPNDDKYRQIKLTNKKFSNEVWRYPACEELMKMSGWVLEADLVRLRDESCIHTVSDLIKSVNQGKIISLPSSVVKIPHSQYKAVLKAIFDGSIADIQTLLNHNNISTAGTIMLQTGESVDLLEAAISIQKVDVVELLFKTYSVDFYLASTTVVDTIFCTVPQSFAIEFLKLSGVRQNFKFEGMKNTSLLHLATMYKCFDIIRFLITRSRDIDVNITDDFLRTPLHYACLAKHTES